MSIRNPFTPGSGRFPPYFADRDREIRAFHERLQSTLDGTPRHMAVFGDSGLGKTSLLMRLQRLASEQGCLTAFGGANLKTPEPFLNGIIRTLIRQIHASYGESVANRLAESIDLQAPLIPPQRASDPPDALLTADLQATLQDHLRIVWHHIRPHAEAIVLLIDEVASLDDARLVMSWLHDTLAQLREDDAKVMGVICGTREQFDQLSDRSFARAFEPLELQPLSDRASYDALTMPLTDTSLQLDNEVTARIVELAAGHPYYLQELAYHTFELAGFDRRRASHRFELALEQTLHTVSTTIFEPQIAALNDPERRLLGVLVRLEEPAHPNDIVEAAVPMGFNERSIPDLLRGLVAKGCIEQVTTEPADGCFTLPDPLFREYVQRHLDWLG